MSIDENVEREAFAAWVSGHYKLKAVLWEGDPVGIPAGPALVDSMDLTCEWDAWLARASRPREAGKCETHDEARRDGAAHALAFVRDFYPPCEEPADLSAREIASNAADAYRLPTVAPEACPVGTPLYDTLAIKIVDHLNRCGYFDDDAENIAGAYAEVHHLMRVLRVTPPASATAEGVEAEHIAVLADAMLRVTVCHQCDSEQDSLTLAEVIAEPAVAEALDMVKVDPKRERLRAAARKATPAPSAAAPTEAEVEECARVLLDRLDTVAMNFYMKPERDALRAVLALRKGAS